MVYNTSTILVVNLGGLKNEMVAKILFSYQTNLYCCTQLKIYLLGTFKNVSWNRFFPMTANNGWHQYC